MKLIIENTSEIVTLAGGLKGRVWEGTTATGIPVSLLVLRVAVRNDADNSAFERELVEVTPKRPERPLVFDPRFIL